MTSAHHTNPPRGLLGKAALRLRNIPVSAVESVARAFPKKSRPPMEKPDPSKKPYTGPKEIPSVRVAGHVGHFRRYSMVVPESRKVG